VSPNISVRRDLRPGDLGAIIAHHGRVYSPEYGVDSTFEAHVAHSVAVAGKRDFPNEREGLWIVEADGRHAGSIALTEEPDGTATVRWFVFDAQLRGRGLGRRLVGEVVDLAEKGGFELVQLETFSKLEAAAHLYRSFGFRVVSADTAPRWGLPEITYQRYELNFQRCAQDLSSTSAGSSSRPFSVKA
jgi:ribosomal protein S18 acetylase RimI-like enzyme